MNTYPMPGGPMEQTAFTIELFRFIDTIVTESQNKNDQAAMAEMNKPKPK